MPKDQLGDSVTNAAPWVGSSSRTGSRWTVPVAGISFAQIPDPIPSPERADPGWTVASFTLPPGPDGTFYDYAVPPRHPREAVCSAKLAPSKRGSNRRARVKTHLARAQARADTLRTS